MIIAAVIAAVIFASCSAGEPGGLSGLDECLTEAVATEVPGTTSDDADPYFCRGDYQLAGEADSPATVLLAAIPNSPVYRELIVFDDLATAARIHDIQRPARGSGEEALKEYILSLARTNGGLYYAAFTVMVFSKHRLLRESQNSKDQDFPGELDVADADTLGMIGLPGLGRPPALSIATLSQSDFTGVQDTDFEIVKSDIGTFAVGVRSIGASLDFDAERAEAVIEVARGKGDSIHQETDFVDATRALYGLGSVSGAVSDASRDSQEVVRLVSEARKINQDIVDDAVNSAPLLKPFNVGAVGGGVDEMGERFTTIALVHDNEQLARDNVTLLIGRINNSRMAVTDWPKSFAIKTEPLEDGTLPWSAVVDRAEFSISGRILMVRMYGLINAHALAPIKARLGQLPVPGTLLVY